MPWRNASRLGTKICVLFLRMRWGTTSNVEIKKVLLWESGTVMFEDVDGGIRSEDSISTSQGIYPLLAAVRDELKAREGIKI